MWSKKRHSIITAIISPFLKAYFRFKFNYKVKKEKLPDEGAIILSNHSTFWDPFFISVKFNKPIYYMCSIHMFQNKFLGKLIKFLVAPIPKEKNNKASTSITLNIDPKSISHKTSTANKYIILVILHFNNK